MKLQEMLEKNNVLLKDTNKDIKKNHRDKQKYSQKEINDLTIVMAKKLGFID